MGDYYKTSATVPEPRYVSPTRKQTPTSLRSGGYASQPYPSPQDEFSDPTIIQNPQSGLREQPASVQRQPHVKIAEPSPTHHQTVSHGQLKAAPVNATLRQRCHGCERILRRLLPLILLFFYSLFGGMLFHLVEKEHESELLRQGAPGRAFIDEPAAVQLNKRFTEIVLDSNYTRDRRTYEVRQALLWYFDILDGRWRTVYGVEKTKWDFVSALFYSVSVYTTIGYGKPAPATTAGQVLTVFYALIGIPLAIVALVQLGFVFACLIGKLWSCLRHGTSNRSNRSRGSDWQAVPLTELESRLREERDDVDLLTFPLSAIVLLFILWMLLVAALFFAWERPRWSYGESFYFTFISLSTIGLGDYKPWSGWGKLLGAVLLILGLALLFTILALFIYQMEALYRSMERAIEAEYRDALTDTGEPMSTSQLAVDDGLKRIASRLPFGSRCLYFFMPEARKRSLRKMYKNKASLLNKGMQTDDYLWAMSPTGILKTIGEETRSPYEDTKSRDDVNSLVAMCDYTLPPPYRGTRLEY